MTKDRATVVAATIIGIATRRLHEAMREEIVALLRDEFEDIRRTVTSERPDAPSE